MHARSNNSETTCVLLGWSSNCLADYRIKALGNIAIVKIYSVIHLINCGAGGCKIGILPPRKGAGLKVPGFKRLCKMCDGHSNSGCPTELLKGTKN